VISGGIGCLIATGWVAASTPELVHYRAGTVATPRAVGAADPPRTEQGESAAG
jgi:hypothetical protein